VAVIAVALHTVLWAAVTLLTAASAIDLFPVIGLSETSPSAEQVQVDDPRAPAHARDHCNLCSGRCTTAGWKEVRLAFDPPTPGS
jgi:hypothetical protein